MIILLYDVFQIIRKDFIMPTRKTQSKAVKTRENGSVEPKRLSKIGEWMKAHPKGIGKIIDMRAAMK